MMIDRKRCDQRDSLTGTATVQAMCRFLEAALDLSEPQGPRVALLAIGIDGLEEFATRHGAAMVDAALLGIADQLRNGLRAHDLVGRLPEGFCVCLPEALTAQACGAAERLQRLLQATLLPTPQGPVALRCSLGLALGHGPGSSADDLMARARAALAAAQAAGGSRLVTDQ
jgi:diguanylate cyclase (GGDEF)-like protein